MEIIIALVVVGVIVAFYFNRKEATSVDAVAPGGAPYKVPEPVVELEPVVEAPAKKPAAKKPAPAKKAAQPKK